MQRIVSKASSMAMRLALVLALACGLVPAAFGQAHADEADAGSTAEEDASVCTESASYETVSSEALSANFGQTALEGDDLELYSELREFIADLAANGGSSIFTKTITITSTSSAFPSYSVNTSIIYYLLVDCPYDLYWYDKTVGAGFGLSTSRHGPDSSGYYTFTVRVTIYFSVSEDYAGDEDYTVDAELAKATSAATETAKAIVDEYADETNIATVLTAYKDEICALTSYNYDAANDDDTPYGDPWQLVYVFDGDSSTNVVCEGYSKAFQYLCDLTWPDNDPVTSYIVTGTMSGGGHMWNIVRIDGKSYLVDVTNSDTGTVGSNGSLFLAKAPSSGGSATSGYKLSGYTYLYDDNTLEMYGEEILTLADEDFPDVDIVTAPTATDFTYTGSELTGVDATSNDYYTVSGTTSATDAGTYTVTLSLTDPDAFVWSTTLDSDDLTLTWTIEQASIENYTSFIGDVYGIVYDGTAQTPSWTIVVGGLTLVEGTDYTVSYSDNVDAGTATATFAGIGNYTGTLTATFEIAKADQQLAFESDAVEVHVNGTPGANALSGAQGEVTYSSSDESVATVDADGAVTAVAAGEATITATAAATSNYNEAQAGYALTVTAHEAGDAVVENEVAATCTEEGSSDVVTYCTICGEELSRETLTVATTGHDYAFVEVEPTCTEAGYTAYICTVCGDTYVISTTAATGHTWDEGAVTKEATAAEEGVITYTCTVCGETCEEAIPATGEEAVSYSFSDVQDASTYYYAPVYAVAEAGYMTGEGDGTSFGVGRSLNRQAMVVVLYRIFASGEEQAAYGSTSDSEGYADNATSLTDVKDAKYYTAAVNWAYDTGVATGYSTGAFGVGDKCSFQQFCTFVARALGEDETFTDAEAKAALASFADGSKVAAYADNSVAYLCSVVYDDEGNTVVGGTAAGRLNPASSVSRERTATVVYRCMAAGLF